MNTSRNTHGDASRSDVSTPASFTIEVSVFDASKIDAIIRKIQNDARVIVVREMSR